MSTQTWMTGIMAFIVIPIIVYLMKRKPTSMGDVHDMAHKPMKSISLKSRALEVIIVVSLFLILVTVLVLRGMSLRN